MQLANLALLASFILPAYAAWQSVYNSNFSLVYIQSSDGSLYRLPISETNVTVGEVENTMVALASPPANSSLVLDSDDHLFAIWGSRGCETAPIEISQYDADQNKWRSVAQSNINTQRWYLDSQITWVDRSEDVIYIYGGTCDGQTHSRFYSYDLTNNTFKEMEEQGKVMPRQMSDAQAVPLSDYETLILGGRSGNAWMSMQQIAVWGYGSWTFSSVSNSTNIDSRENPLLLPLWKDGLNGTTGSVDKVLVIGGTVAGRKAKPEIVLLEKSQTEGWIWRAPNSDNSIDLTFAASTLYSTLATLSSKSTGSSGSGSKRAVALYGHNDDNNWSPVNSVSVAKPAEPAKPTSKSSHSTSTATIAVVSTLLPIIVICFAVVGAWWWWYKRRQRRLFLLPNRRGMLRRQPSENSSFRSEPLWSSSSAQGPINAASFPRVPQREPDSGSIMMMESSEGNRLFMSKQRRSLRVVNPDEAQPSPIMHHASEFRSSREGSSAEGSSRERTSRERTSREGSRDSSWSSSSKVNPFEDSTDLRSDFDFGM